MKRPARLTGALLARKGQAAPAQTASPIYYPFAEATEGETPRHDLTQLAEASAARPRFAPPPAAEVKAAKNNGGKSRDFGGRAAGPTDVGGNRAALTLRLDEERHLRLRVFSAHSKRSSQDILTQALDEYLERHSYDGNMRHCDCLHQPGGKC
ncbi:MAG: hypothetical protein DCC73_02455 [Proteobacteria bacterium]|jgi:hypothetical protein|nr:MAG: hypothetical protein DCC73_02455 [Pseudomonadota bacterium]